MTRLVAFLALVGRIVGGRTSFAMWTLLFCTSLVPTRARAQAIEPLRLPPALIGSVLGTVTPSFSIAPRAVFARRGPRGARMRDNYASVWLSTNVHDLLPPSMARTWPAPVRLSVGRRVLPGPQGAEYAVGLDLDAARLPGNHPAWVAVKRLLHTVRVPGPALVIAQGRARGALVY